MGSDGKWEPETYIPAFLRRYPYILAEGVSQDGSFAVCIDADYPGFDRKKGERLFTEEGENTPALNNVLEFLRLYQNQYEATKAFTGYIKELNIFKAVDANVKLVGGDEFTFRNLLMIDEQAMYKLADEEIVKLVRQGYMPALDVRLDGDIETLIESYSGQHYAICYGDYSDGIEALARILGIRTIRV